MRPPARPARLAPIRRLRELTEPKTARSASLRWSGLVLFVFGMAGGHTHTHTRTPTQTPCLRPAVRAHGRLTDSLARIAPRVSNYKHLLTYPRTHVPRTHVLTYHLLAQAGIVWPKTPRHPKLVKVALLASGATVTSRRVAACTCTPCFARSKKQNKAKEEQTKTTAKKTTKKVKQFQTNQNKCNETNQNKNKNKWIGNMQRPAPPAHKPAKLAQSAAPLANWRLGTTQSVCPASRVRGRAVAHPSAPRVGLATAVTYPRLAAQASANRAQLAATRKLRMEVVDDDDDDHDDDRASGTR